MKDSRIVVGALALTLLVGCNTGSHSSRKAGSTASGSTAGVGSAHVLVAPTNGMGQISVAPPPLLDGSYAPGTTVTITATAATDRIFRTWTGDLAGRAENPIQVVVDRDLNVGADFFQPNPNAPRADFSVSPAAATGDAPFELHFTDRTNGTTSSWLWDFGDGAASTARNPTHIYKQPGVYTVTLNVTDGGGTGPGFPRVMHDLVVVTDPNAPAAPATPGTTGLPGSNPSVVGQNVGSPYWYEGNTFGNPLRTNDANQQLLAQQILDLVNMERAKVGLGPLALDLEAEKAAVAHSADMAGRGFFGHMTPENWGPVDRLRLLGITGWLKVGENIAVGQGTPADIVATWMASPGHRANILDPEFTHLGVGIQGGQPFWTQVFLQR